MGYAFDGAAKRVTLTPGTTQIVLADLWSRWKDWVLAGNAQHLPAFDTVGGDIAAIPLYLFPVNGWKIVPQAANHTLSVTGGILATADDSDPFVDPVGTFKIRINREAPAIAIGYSTTGGSSGPSAATVAAAVLAALGGTPVPADVRSVNGVAITGAGVPGNSMRPA